MRRSCRRRCRPTRRRRRSHAPEEVPRLHLQGSDTQPDQPARPRGRLGGGHRPAVPQRPRAVTEIDGERDTPTGRALYIAKPIQITTGLPRRATATPEAAPGHMVKHYGEANGFGWKRNEIDGRADRLGADVGAAPQARRRPSRPSWPRWWRSSSLAFIVLNVMLRSLIIRPIVRMSAARPTRSAPATSRFPNSRQAAGTRSRVLATSFNRMRRSLEKAMKLLE